MKNKAKNQIKESTQEQYGGVGFWELIRNEDASLMKCKLGLALTNGDGGYLLKLAKGLF